jgi:hypothetical protein
VIFEAQK